MDLGSWWIAYSFALVSLTKVSGRFTGGLSNERMQGERWGRGRTDLCSHRTLETGRRLNCSQEDDMARGTAWHAGGLNVNHMSYVLKCVNTWSPVGGALGKFVEPSGGGALLEEVSQWGQALRFDNLTTWHHFLFTLLPGSWCAVISQHLAPTTMLSPLWGSDPLDWWPEYPPISIHSLLGLQPQQQEE